MLKAKGKRALPGIGWVSVPWKGLGAGEGARAFAPPGGVASGGEGRALRCHHDAFMEHGYESDTVGHRASQEEHRIGAAAPGVASTWGVARHGDSPRAHPFHPRQ